jgi:hypothetical protein
MSATRENTGNANVHADLTALAEILLRHYNVTQPPVPIERMMNEPPPGLGKLDPDRISVVMEHGLFSYAPRLAMARLLCREIARSSAAQASLGVDISLLTYDDVKFFARCLLMPQQWMQSLSEQRLSVEHISHYLQAPSDAVVTRLGELGLPIPEK